VMHRARESCNRASSSLGFGSGRYNLPGSTPRQLGTCTIEMWATRRLFAPHSPRPQLATTAEDALAVDEIERRFSLARFSRVLCSPRITGPNR
jgi:hypothetical protein